MSKLKAMTVGQLKAALAGRDNDIPVFINAIPYEKQGKAKLGQQNYSWRGLAEIDDWLPITGDANSPFVLSFNQDVFGCD